MAPPAQPEPGSARPIRMFGHGCRSQRAPGPGPGGWKHRHRRRRPILRNWSIVRGGTSSAQKALFFNLRRLRAKLARGDTQLTLQSIHQEIAAALGVSLSDVQTMDADLRSRLDKALEIDCYPDRQDLNLALLKLARTHGTRISLGTDAHHPWQLEFIDLGLAAALGAKIPADRVINFMPILELKAWAQQVRDRTRSRG